MKISLIFYSWLLLVPKGSPRLKKEAQKTTSTLKVSPISESFLTLFGTFRDVIFWSFLETLPERVFGDFGAQRPPKREAFWGNFRSFFWNPRFLVFDDPYNEKQLFWQAGGSRNRSFFEVFFKGRFWEASGERFLQILMIFGPPWEACLKTFGYRGSLWASPGEPFAALGYLFVGPVAPESL